MDDDHRRGFDDPISPIERVLLRYREVVAQATEQAVRDLRDLGVGDPAPYMWRTSTGWIRPSDAYLAHHDPLVKRPRRPRLLPSRE